MFANKKEFGGTPVLDVCKISKNFGGTQALREVEFSIHQGEILALLGENGAGKSTLIKLLAGIHIPDQGEFRFCGEKFNPGTVHSGVSFIHQDLGLIEWMTVAENISLAYNAYPRRFGLIDWQEVKHKAKENLAMVSYDIDPEMRVQDLTRTEKSLVSIARALARNAKLLILDEPTASLPQSDVEALHSVLRRLSGDGVAMIYVSHRLDEVFAIGHRTVVLRDGIVVADERIDKINGDDLIKLIVGRKLEEVLVHTTRSKDDCVSLTLENLIVEDVGPVNLQLRRGEILGLVGLRGAGQDTIGRALFGCVPIRSGKVLLEDGKGLMTDHPADSICQGICLVAGDRNNESVAYGLNVKENLFINPPLMNRGLLSFQKPSKESERAKKIGEKFDFRPNAPNAPIETLSGGNQQKVVMARWMNANSSVLILEDPTAGVDVGSKSEIYDFLAKAVSDGLSILLISTDFEEIAAISHRGYVFRNGKIVKEFPEEELSVETLLNAASLEDYN